MAVAVLVGAATPQGERLQRLALHTLLPERSATHVLGLLALRLTTWVRLLRRRHGHKDRDQQVVVDAADAWAAELQSGRAPAPALALALEQAPAPFSSGADRIRLGSDPMQVLMELSSRPGAEGLRSLAACWTVAQTAGAGLADPVRRVARGLRDARTVQMELQAQVAAPKATARLVASLPIAGPLLGALIGADTIGVLLTTPAGRSCLVVGVALNLLGVWWVRRIIASVAAA